MGREYTSSLTGRPRASPLFPLDPPQQESKDEGHLEVPLIPMSGPGLRSWVGPRKMGGTGLHQDSPLPRPTSRPPPLANWPGPYSAWGFPWGNPVLQGTWLQQATLPGPGIVPIEQKKVALSPT